VTSPYAVPPRHTPGETRARWVAAAVCSAQALALAGFCAYYLYELGQEGSDDPTRVVMSVVLMLLFAVGLGVLGWFWARSDAGWPTTPTIVWNLLLLPVAVSMAQAGQKRAALVVGIVALTGLGAAIVSRPVAGPADES
jgi:hypothetical protein